MFSFKEFLSLQEIASDSWLTPPIEPTSGYIGVYGGPIEGIHRKNEEPIGSMKTRLDPVMAPSKRIRHSKKMKKI